MIWRNSVTLRLTLLFSLLSSAVLLGAAHLVRVATASHFEAADVEEMAGKLELVRNILSPARTPVDLEAAPRVLESALVGHHGLSLAVRLQDGHLLFSTPGARFPPDLLAGANASGSAHTSPRTWTLGDKTMRGIAATANVGDGSIAPAVVAIALDIGYHQRFMARFQRTLWAVLSAGIFITTLLGWIVARRGLAPVRRMAFVARGISASHLGERLALDEVPSELVELGAAFNAMLARLEDSFRRLSDFSSDLAHELRTPISNLKTQTEVVLSRPRSNEAYKEILYSNLEEYERLARMTSDMLYLAKAEDRSTVLNWESIDLAHEVRELFDFYEALADEQGVRLVHDGKASMVGDRSMIRRALGNLLSNAIRHTPRGGEVAVHVATIGDDRIRIAVENAGEKIPAAHLDRLFERFHRVDPARQSSSEGVGLGLAITKSIVEAHDGSISVESNDRVTVFSMVFPAGRTSRPPQ